jgi:hypothetical protein
VKNISLGESGMVAMVDDHVFHVVCDRQWLPLKSHNVWYARDAKTLEPLHRVVMALHGTDSACIDHIDRDGLNNQRGNLRPATTAQNGWNSKRAVGASGHPGVSRNRANWAVRFEHEGTTMYFGTHRDLEVAKAIASREMLRLRGDFLPLDHPARLAELERGGHAA